MTSYQKFGLVVGQIFIGLGFGLGGAVIASAMTYTTDLYGAIMYALIGGYFGIQIGIAFDGFRFLRRNERQTEFFRFLGQSIIGLISALALFYMVIIPMGLLIPNGVINFLSIALPLIGVIAGFNFRLIVKE